MATEEINLYPETMNAVTSLMEKLTEWDETAPNLYVYGPIKLVDEAMCTVGFVRADGLGFWAYIPSSGEPKQ